MTLIQRRSDDEFVNNLTAVYLNSVQTDVVLVCDGRKINAHRTVLASISPLFQEIFASECCCSESTIILEGFSFEVLQKLVTFVYSGATKCTEQDLLQFASYFKYLDIKGLGNVTMSQVDTRIAESQLASLENDTTDCDSDSDSGNSEDSIEVLFQSRDVEEANRDFAQTEEASSTADIPPTKKPRTAKEKKSNAVNTTLTNNSTKPPDQRSKIPLTCKICGGEFPTKYQLTKHRKTHKQNEPASTESLKCAICNKQYKTARGLSQHLHDHIQSSHQVFSTFQAGFRKPST